MVQDDPGSAPSPGWYEDPINRGQERLWDGQQWTNEVRDPVPAQPDPELQIPSPGPPRPTTEAHRLPAGGNRDSFLVAGASVVLAAGIFAAISTLLTIVAFISLDLETRFQVTNWIALPGDLLAIAAAAVAIAAFRARTQRRSLLATAASLFLTAFAFYFASDLYSMLDNILGDSSEPGAIPVAATRAVGDFAFIAAAWLVASTFRKQQNRGNRSYLFVAAISLAIYAFFMATSRLVNFVAITDHYDYVPGGIKTGIIFIVLAFLILSAAWIIVSIGFRQYEIAGRDLFIAIGAFIASGAYLVATIGSAIYTGASNFEEATQTAAVWIAAVSTMLLCVAAALVAGGFMASRRASTHGTSLAPRDWPEPQARR